MNDLEEGEEDAQGLEDRAADGEQAFATADERDMNGDGLEGPSDSGALPRHKWHPHTVKVRSKEVPPCHIYIYIYSSIWWSGVILFRGSEIVKKRWIGR